MQVKEYQEIIKKTAIFPEEIKYAYCMLGLNGEFNEFVDSIRSKSATQKDRVKECGDVWWYLTALCIVHELDPKEVFPVMVNYDRTMIFQSDHYKDRVHHFIGRMSEITKKFYRDGNFPVPEHEIKDILSQLSYFLYGLVIVHELDINVVLATNYEKLMKRRETGTLHGSGDNREEQ